MLSKWFRKVLVSGCCNWLPNTPEYFHKMLSKWFRKVLVSGCCNWLPNSPEYFHKMFSNWFRTLACDIVRILREKLNNLCNNITDITLRVLYLKWTSHFTPKIPCKKVSKMKSYWKHRFFHFQLFFCLTEVNICTAMLNLVFLKCDR